MLEGTQPEVRLWLQSFDAPINHESQEKDRYGFGARIYPDWQTNDGFRFNYFTQRCNFAFLQATWIAVDPNAPNIATGWIDTGKPASASDYRTGRVSFPTGKFDCPPRVYIAARDLCTAWGGDNPYLPGQIPSNPIRFHCCACDITDTDFMWCVETWDQGRLDMVNLDWIAIG